MMAYSSGPLTGSTDRVLLKREVRVVAAKSVENYTVYIIELVVDDCTWTIQRRYSEFHDLHDKLVGLKRAERYLLPPKKFLWKQSKSFVEKRRLDLESYLQKLLDQSSYLATPLLHFLEFDIYDIYGVSQALATELFDKAEAIIASDDVCEMTPMQLYAITERLKLAVPTCSADDSRSDIGHIMDFISRLKLMRIVGSRNRLGSSSRVVDKLPFDLSTFRALEHLQIDVCNFGIISGLVELKKTLRYLAVHHTVKSIKEILLPEGEHWLNAQAGAMASPSSSHLPVHIPTWKYISRADFRYNSLTDVDESIKLLPNLTRLDLSHNDLTEVNNLQYLSEMTHLDLSHNCLGSLDGLHTRLGNITTLGLAANSLSSLRGLGKLYSLVHLDVSKNSIEHVLELNHISTLPCIESLNLKDNPVTGVMDYRTKVLSLFHEQYTELTLDGQGTSQKEMDRVAIMMAIQKAKDAKVKKLTRKPSPSRKKHVMPVNQATIADPANQKPSLVSMAAASASSSVASSQSSLHQHDDLSASSFKDDEYRAKVEEIRREGGEAWLTLLNEMREPPEALPSTLKAKGGHSPKSERSPQAKRKDNPGARKSRSRSRSPVPPGMQPPPASPTLKISPKGLLHCIFDELARHRMDCPASVPELIFNLHIYFQGPVLSTYGPRHKRQNQPAPDAQGPSVAVYLLEHMTSEHRAEFVELLQGLSMGKVHLPSHIFPKREDAAEVFACVLRVLGLEQQAEDELEEPTVDEMAKLTVNYNDSPEVDLTDVGVDPSVDFSVGNLRASPAIVISEHPSPPVIRKHVPAAPPRIIPTYEASTLENLAQCNMQVGLKLTEPMQAIANMQASDVVKFFHESIAEIGSEPERLTHMMWAGAIAFQNPVVEITACVMLSDRAVYILSADASSSQILSPPVEARGHRRMKSDSSLKDKLRANSKSGDPLDTAGFNGGRLLKQPHASGVLLMSTEDRDRKRVRCQHVLNLTDIVEVDVGLFDQKLRLTAETARDTVSLLTRNFQVTLSFLEWLMQVLPITSNNSRSPDRSPTATDPYKLHRSFTEEFLHPSSVKFSYPNDETINDLTYLIVDFIDDKAKTNMDNTSILLYMLVHQVHSSPLPQGSPVTVQEPLEECERSHRTLVVTNKHLSLCREDHVSYPLPGFMKSLPDHQQYKLLEVQEIKNLRRLVVSDFSSRDVTLVFEVMEVVVDITVDHYGSKESGQVVQPAMPEVAWTLVLPSMDDRERLRKQLCHTWLDIHGQELSIQVNT